MSGLPSEGLVRTALATFLPERYTKLVRTEQIAKALAEAEIDDLRNCTAESRQLVKNLRVASIAAKAGDDIQPDVDPSTLDPDFREHFRSKAENVTREDIQSFMGKLLASEYNRPGSMSKRAATIVAEVDRTDAEALTNLSRFRWSEQNNEIQTYLMGKITDAVYRQQGITWESLNTLISLGVIVGNPVMQYTRTLLQTHVCSYHSKVIVMKKLKNNVSVSAGSVLLTDVGRQIMQLLPQQPPVPGYAELCVKTWNQSEDIRVDILSSQ